jgi:ATP-dependent Zn protease
MTHNASNPDNHTPTNPDNQTPGQTSSARRRGWQLVRLMQNILLTIVTIGLLGLLVPPLIRFVSGPDFAPVILQMVLLGGYLLLFIGFQLFLIYVVLARTRTSWVYPSRADVSFAHYRGNPAVLHAAQRIVALLHAAQEQSPRGSSMLHGLLLIGPPGAGKRYLAQTIASEAGVPIGYINASSLTVSRFDLGAIKLARLYGRARRVAREYGACILLLEHIEHIGGAAHPHPGLLSELLLQIDPPFQRARWWQLWFAVNPTGTPPVLTIATATSKGSLDGALFRPNRFDREIRVTLPDTEGCRDIVYAYLKQVSHGTLPLEPLVGALVGQPPLLIKKVINEALLYAQAQGRQQIEAADVEQSCASYGLELRAPAPPAGTDSAEPAPLPPPLSYEERRRIAYHEAGHIYARRRLLPHYAASSGLDDDLFPDDEPDSAPPAMTHSELLHYLQITLAGRAAETVLLGSATTAALDDLRRATRIATLLIGALGMDQQLSSVLAPGHASLEQTVHTNDLRARVEALLQEQYQAACTLVRANHEAITTLAEALILPSEFGTHDVHALLERIAARYPFHAGSISPAPAAPLVARRAVPPPAAPEPEAHVPDTWHAAASSEGTTAPTDDAALSAPDVDAPAATSDTFERH